MAKKPIGRESNKDALILLLAAYKRIPLGGSLGPGQPELAKACDEINEFSPDPGGDLWTPENAEGVLSCFAYKNPDDSRSGTAPSKAVNEIWEQYGNNPEALKGKVSQITSRSVLNEYELNKLLNDYKRDLRKPPADSNKALPEVYKWEALEQFQKEWDIDASDFLGMFNKAFSKKDNLFYRQYFMGMTDLIKASPDAVRDAFKLLFSEADETHEAYDSEDLVVRISEFIRVIREIPLEDNKEDHQSMLTVGPYLWFRYPLKYYLYNNNNAFETVATILGFSLPNDSTSPDYLISIYKLCEAIKNKLIQDQELLTLVNNNLWDDYAALDGNYHLLTQDVIWYQSHDRSERIDVSDPKVTQYANILRDSYNVVLHGAPGTGKTYLARKIAEEIVGDESKFDEHIKLVQFHPSYDYTDFVEGLRPFQLEDGSGVGFELKSGSFMEFCNSARIGTDSGKVFEAAWLNALKQLDETEEPLELTTPVHKKPFILEIKSGDSLRAIPQTKLKSEVTIKKQKLQRFFNGEEVDYYKPYYTAVREWMTKEFNLPKELNIEHSMKLPFVFIIDEINRGEISKIFGELFLSIDPEYRGSEAYAVETQYSNMHETKKERFFVPDNVYVIGTMNDIDRSVESFDFAMRRRFRFVELTSESQLDMLDRCREDFDVEEAKKRIRSLNKSIDAIDGLDTGYHIGPSYFLKLKELNGDFDILWNHYIEPLVKEYLRGRYDMQSHLDKLRKAYSLQSTSTDDNNPDDDESESM